MRDLKDLLEPLGQTDRCPIAGIRSAAVPLPLCRNRGAHACPCTRCRPRSPRWRCPSWQGCSRSARPPSSDSRAPRINRPRGSPTRPTRPRTPTGTCCPTRPSGRFSHVNAIPTPVGTGGAGSKQMEYVIVLHGSFTAYGASPPAGTPPPKGSVLSIAYDASTHDVTDFGLTDGDTGIQGLHLVQPSSLVGRLRLELRIGRRRCHPVGPVIMSYTTWLVLATQVLTSRPRSRSSWRDSPLYRRLRPSASPAMRSRSWRPPAQGPIPPQTRSLSPPAAAFGRRPRQRFGNRPDSRFDVLPRTERRLRPHRPYGRRCFPPGFLAAANAVIGSIAWPSSASSSSSEPAASGLPSADSVVDGRFVRSVQLDNGLLRVDPSPAGAVPQLSKETTDLLWASSAFQAKTP